jgi:tetratricopeptide (TPR) repeat protein
MRKHTWFLLAALVTAAARATAHEGVSAEIAALDKKIAKDPGDASLFVRRAALLRREGHPSRALADLARADARSPGRRDVLLERGLSLWAMGNQRGAESALDRFLASGPAALPALAARGKIREAHRQFEGARADYDSAVRLRPDPELYLARGRADEAAGKLERAAEGYEQALTALSGATTVRLALIRVESRRGSFDRARALVDEVLATVPRKADWLLLRADVHSAAGSADLATKDREAALLEVEETLARRPSDLARLTRAKALLSLGRTQQAVSDLEAVVSRSPRLAEAQKLLSAAKAPAGKK